MPWDDTFTPGLDDWVARFEAAIPDALLVGAEVLKAGAVERAPVESGHLRGSAEVTVQNPDAGFDAFGRVRFPGPYARRQHYELDWKHPRGGQALYLYTALMVDGPKAVRAIGDCLGGIL